MGRRKRNNNATTAPSASSSSSSTSQLESELADEFQQLEKKFSDISIRDNSVIISVQPPVLANDEIYIFAFGNNDATCRLVDFSEKSTYIQLARARASLMSYDLCHMTSGAYHTLAMSRYGQIYSWGQNKMGQLGLGFSCESRVSIKKVAMPAGTKIVDMSAGWTHSLFLASSGRVFGCGSNNYGQLGISSTDNRTVEKPTMITELYKHDIVQISTMNEHSMALSSRGRVFCFGMNAKGQLGLGHTRDEDKPQKVRALKPFKIIQIAAGYEHSMALTSGGVVFVWGSNSSGQSGAGPTSHSLTTPRAVGMLKTPVISIFSGVSHCLAQGRDGMFYTWGNNIQGQCGVGSRESYCEVTKIRELVGKAVTQVTVGYHHTLICTKNDEVFSFGKNNRCQLGHARLEGDLPTATKIAFQLSTLRSRRVTKILATADSSYIMVFKFKQWPFPLSRKRFTDVTVQCRF